MAGLVLQHRFEDEVHLSMLQDVPALAQLATTPLENEPSPSQLEGIKKALAELRKRHVTPDGEMVKRKRGGKRKGAKGAAESAGALSQEEEDELAM